jgi:hypothetical protein
MNKISLKKAFITILIETLTTSTIHGLPNLIRSNRKVVKILWTICFLISSGLCAYLVIESLLSYLKFCVVTSVRVFNEPSSEFPAIVLCNKNNYNNEFYEELVKNSILNFSSIHLYDTKKVNDAQIELENMRIKISSYLMSKTQQERKEKGIPLDQLLISCQHFNKMCDSTNFTWNFHYTYGNCYILYSAQNSNGKWNPPKRTNKQNHYNSLKIELYTGEPNKFEALSSSSGFQLFVLNRSDSYNKFNFFDLSPGFEYNIMLERTFLEQKPKPYSNCEFVQDKANALKSPFIKTMKELNLTYSRADCLNLCYQHFTFQKCNCIDYTIDARLESKFCFSDEELSCASDFFYFEYSKNGFIEINCDPYCPIECEKGWISPIISFSKYPTENYFEILRINKKLQQKVFKNSSSSYVKESLLKLNIYYPRLSYTLITEEIKMSTIDLLSSIGGIFVFIKIKMNQFLYLLIFLFIFYEGTMGLFLGISFLSFVEFIEAFIELMYRICQ